MSGMGGNGGGKLSEWIGLEETFPQGLKPDSFCSDFGPVKAVPLLQNSSAKWMRLFLW
jgi:hypothetical protein